MNIADFLTDFKLEQDVNPRAPHAISVHIGWLNWGNVGEAAFQELLQNLRAVKIAEFERPGDFYNFVTYRDHSRTFVDITGNRRTEMPNSRIYYAKRKEPLNDLVLMFLLEPTQFGEIFVDRVVSLLKKLNVVRYQTIGAMGSSVPHTRPIMVTGRSSNPAINRELKDIGVRETTGTTYQGPTSIFNAISPQLQSAGVPTVSLIANLPTYFSLEETDWTGVCTILKLMSKLEGVEVPMKRLESLGRKQYDGVTREVNASEKMMSMVTELESQYDEEEAKRLDESEIQLPPNIQKAIDEIMDKG